MITVPLIPWHPIAAMPDDRKDGRELLLSERNTLGTANGGDGLKLNPRRPYLYYIACWHPEYGAWRTTENDGADSFYLDTTDVDWWADINPPE